MRQSSATIIRDEPTHEAPCLNERVAQAPTAHGLFHTPGEAFRAAWALCSTQLGRGPAFSSFQDYRHLCHATCRPYTTITLRRSLRTPDSSPACGSGRAALQAASRARGSACTAACRLTGCSQGCSGHVGPAEVGKHRVAEAGTAREGSGLGFEMELQRHQGKGSTAL